MKPPFTRSELIELERALRLIAGEDRACHVNMGAAAVRAKRSALAKLHTLVGDGDPFAHARGAKSVSVTEILKKLDREGR